MGDPVNPVGARHPTAAVVESPARLSLSRATYSQHGNELWAPECGGPRCRRLVAPSRCLRQRLCGRARLWAATLLARPSLSCTQGQVVFAPALLGVTWMGGLTTEPGIV